MPLFNTSKNNPSAIVEYRQRCAEHSACSDGAEAFSRCKTRKDVYELAASPLASDFLLRSIYEGWGPGVDEVEHTFKSFINGRYTSRCKVSEDRVVCSQMWCNTRDVSISDNIRHLVLIGCRGSVDIEEWQVVKILVDCNSRIEIHAKSGSIVFVENYGGQVTDMSGRARIVNKITDDDRH